MLPSSQAWCLTYFRNSFPHYLLQLLPGSYLFITAPPEGAVDLRAVALIFVLPWLLGACSRARPQAVSWSTPFLTIWGQSFL